MYLALAAVGLNTVINIELFSYEVAILSVALT
jgi:hypothetical protein